LSWKINKTRRYQRCSRYSTAATIIAAMNI
jgi:hypothetical protein